MRERIQKFMRDEEGASAVEYGVLIALIIAICVVVISVLGGRVNQAFVTTRDALPAGTAEQ